MRNTKKSTGFFEYDRKVLRFYGMWDSRDRLFGDELKVHIRPINTLCQYTPFQYSISTHNINCRHNTPSQPLPPPSTHPPYKGASTLLSCR